MKTNKHPAMRFMPDLAGIPIHALFGRDISEPNPDPAPRASLMTADVVLGRDLDSGHEFLVYGRPALDAMARSGRAARVRCLVVELDMQTLELEALVALVTVLRGRHDYLAWSEAAPEQRVTPEQVAFLDALNAAKGRPPRRQGRG